MHKVVWLGTFCTTIHNHLSVPWSETNNYYSWTTSWIHAVRRVIQTVKLINVHVNLTIKSDLSTGQCYEREAPLGIIMSEEVFQLLCIFLYLSPFLPDAWGAPNSNKLKQMNIPLPDAHNRSGLLNKIQTDFVCWQVGFQLSGKRVIRSPLVNFCATYAIDTLSSPEQRPPQILFGQSLLPSTLLHNRFRILYESTLLNSNLSTECESHDKSQSPEGRLTWSHWEFQIHQLQELMYERIDK